MVVAAIFDLDGTLVTFNLDIREWRAVIVDAMNRRGFDTAGLSLATPTQEILDIARARAPAGDSKAYESLRKEAFSILDSLELEGAKSATVFPGAEGVLKLLRSRGFRIGMLTNSGRASASLSLSKWGLEGLFEFVLTRDDIEAMKPRPEGLATAVRMLGIRPDEACYVGDSVYDVVAAKGAGVKSVGVATGNYTAGRLRKEGADWVISTLAELPEALGVYAH